MSSWTPASALQPLRKLLGLASVSHSKHLRAERGLWTIAACALLAYTMLFVPATSLAQSCATPPAASSMWEFTHGVNVFEPTTSATCTAIQGATIETAGGHAVTIISSVVDAGSEEYPSPD